MSLTTFEVLCRKAIPAHLFDELLELLLTPTELAALTKRIKIVNELLKEKLTQRELSWRHELSIAKITRGSNQLKKISPELKKFLIKFLPK